MRPRSQDGFTIVELLVGMIVGLIVLLAAFAILDRAYTANREAAERSEASQRGRLAMDKVVQTLRSQVCIGAARSSVVAGDANGITLLVDLTGGNSAPERRTIAYTSSTRTISESIYPASGTFPDYTFSSTPTTTRTLLTNVGPADGNPMFRYYALDATGGRGANLALAAPLSATDMGRTARIAVGFTTRATGATTDRFATTLHDDVFVRSADPINPTGGLRCL
jgi:prepilin-type N-terminal cleavage/methylation domain-containing protein